MNELTPAELSMLWLLRDRHTTKQAVEKAILNELPLWPEAVHLARAYHRSKKDLAGGKYYILGSDFVENEKDSPYSYHELGRYPINKQRNVLVAENETNVKSYEKETACQVVEGHQDLRAKSSPETPTARFKAEKNEHLQLLGDVCFVKLENPQSCRDSLEVCRVSDDCASECEATEGHCGHRAQKTHVGGALRDAARTTRESSEQVKNVATRKDRSTVVDRDCFAPAESHKIPCSESKPDTQMLTEPTNGSTFDFSEFEYEITRQCELMFKPRSPRKFSRIPSPEEFYDLYLHDETFPFYRGKQSDGDSEMEDIETVELTGLNGIGDEMGQAMMSVEALENAESIQDNEALSHTSNPPEKRKSKHCYVYPFEGLNTVMKDTTLKDNSSAIPSDYTDDDVIGTNIFMEISEHRRVEGASSPSACSEDDDVLSAPKDPARSPSSVSVDTSLFSHLQPTSSYAARTVVFNIPQVMSTSLSAAAPSSEEVARDFTFLRHFCHSGAFSRRRGSRLGRATSFRCTAPTEEVVSAICEFNKPFPCYDACQNINIRLRERLLESTSLNSKAATYEDFSSSYKVRRKSIVEFSTATYAEPRVDIVSLPCKEPTCRQQSWSSSLDAVQLEEGCYSSLRVPASERVSLLCNAPTSKQQLCSTLLDAVQSEEGCHSSLQIPASERVSLLCNAPRFLDVTTYDELTSERVHVVSYASGVSAFKPSISSSLSCVASKVENVISSWAFENEISGITTVTIRHSIISRRALRCKGTRVSARKSMSLPFLQRLSPENRMRHAEMDECQLRLALGTMPSQSIDDEPYPPMHRSPPSTPSSEKMRSGICGNSKRFAAMRNSPFQFLGDFLDSKDDLSLIAPKSTARGSIVDGEVFQGCEDWDTCDRLIISEDVLFENTAVDCDQGQRKIKEEPEVSSESFSLCRSGSQQSETLFESTKATETRSTSRRSSRKKSLQPSSPGTEAGRQVKVKPKSVTKIIKLFAKTAASSIEANGPALPNKERVSSTLHLKVSSGVSKAFLKVPSNCNRDDSSRGLKRQRKRLVHEKGTRREVGANKKLSVAARRASKQRKSSILPASPAFAQKNVPSTESHSVVTIAGDECSEGRSSQTDFSSSAGDEDAQRKLPQSHISADELVICKAYPSASGLQSIAVRTYGGSAKSVKKRAPMVKGQPEDHLKVELSFNSESRGCNFGVTIALNEYESVAACFQATSFKEVNHVEHLISRLRVPTSEGVGVKLSTHVFETVFKSVRMFTAREIDNAEHQVNENNIVRMTTGVGICNIEFRRASENYNLGQGIPVARRLKRRRQTVDDCSPSPKKATQNCEPVQSSRISESILPIVAKSVRSAPVSRVGKDGIPLVSRAPSSRGKRSTLLTPSAEACSTSRVTRTRMSCLGKSVSPLPTKRRKMMSQVNTSDTRTTSEVLEKVADAKHRHPQKKLTCPSIPGSKNVPSTPVQFKSSQRTERPSRKRAAPCKAPIRPTSFSFGDDVVFVDRFDRRCGKSSSPPLLAVALSTTVSFVATKRDDMRTADPITLPTWNSIEGVTKTVYSSDSSEILNALALNIIFHEASALSTINMADFARFVFNLFEPAAPIFGQLPEVESSNLPADFTTIFELASSLQYRHRLDYSSFNSMLLNRLPENGLHALTLDSRKVSMLKITKFVDTIKEAVAEVCGELRTRKILTKAEEQAEKDLSSEVQHLITSRYVETVMKLADACSNARGVPVHVIADKFHLLLSGWNSFLQQGGALRVRLQLSPGRSHPEIVALTTAWLDKIDAILSRAHATLSTRTSAFAVSLAQEKNVMGRIWQTMASQTSSICADSSFIHCSECNLYFHNEDTDFMHNRVFHQKSRECEECYDMFHTLLGLDLHLIGCHKRIFVSQVCDSELPTK